MEHIIDPFNWTSAKYPYIYQPDLWSLRVAMYDGTTMFYLGNDGNSARIPVNMAKDNIGENVLLYGYFPIPHVLESVIIYDDVLDENMAFKLVAKEVVPQKLRWMCRSGLQGL